jgi:hypothetical protein
MDGATVYNKTLYGLPLDWPTETAFLAYENDYFRGTDAGGGTALPRGVMTAGMPYVGTCIPPPASAASRL